MLLFQEILEQERQDFEEELENQTERINVLKLQIKQSQQGEVESLKKDNEQLKSLLEQSKNKVWHWTLLLIFVNNLLHKL